MLYFATLRLNGLVVTAQLICLSICVFCQQGLDSGIFRALNFYLNSLLKHIVHCVCLLFISLLFSFFIVFFIYRLYVFVLWMLNQMKINLNGRKRYVRVTPPGNHF